MKKDAGNFEYLVITILETLDKATKQRDFSAIEIVGAIEAAKFVISDSLMEEGKGFDMTAERKYNQ